MRKITKTIEFETNELDQKEFDAVIRLIGAMNNQERCNFVSVEDSRILSELFSSIPRHEWKRIRENVI